jgi:hypothetical protein
MAGRFRRIFAPVTLVVFLASLILPLVPGAHGVWDDDMDGGVGLSPDAYAVAVVQPLPPPTPAEHCALCHWLSALAGAAPAQTVSPVPGLEGRQQLYSFSAERPVQPELLGGSSRAPPPLFTA